MKEADSVPSRDSVAAALCVSLLFWCPCSLLTGCASHRRVSLTASVWELLSPKLCCVRRLVIASEALGDLILSPLFP